MAATSSARENGDARPDVAEQGAAQDERAARHRALAMDAIEDGDGLDAIAHALLAVEARIDELTCYIARLG